MSRPGDSEFGFELLVCRWAELAWPPGADERRPVVVSRQLGTERRRWDTLVIEVEPDAFAARRRFGERTLDSDLLHVVRHAPAEWTWYRDALPRPDYPWRYVRAAVHRAAGRDLIETRRAGNRIELRRIGPYPDWARRIVAVENKPDLDASAARALGDQLRHDVETGLADEVWLATAATGADVEPALFADAPVGAGILTFDFERGGSGPDGATADAAGVHWRAEALDLDRGGERTGGDEGDGAARAERTATRREIAERAYGKGWRSYRETMRPDCRGYELRRVGRALAPWCAEKGRHQTAAECSGSCPAFQPEPPAWRTRGWPIEGGPGKGIDRLLGRRRARARAALDPTADADGDAGTGTDPTGGPDSDAGTGTDPTGDGNRSRR